METSNFKIGQKVTYVNGGLSFYTGEIVKINETSLIVLDNDPAQRILWNAGYAVGTQISFSQVK